MECGPISQCVLGKKEKGKLTDDLADDKSHSFLKYRLKGLNDEVNAKGLSIQ